MSSLLPEHLKGVCACREPERHTPSNISKDIFLKTELREREKQPLDYYAAFSTYAVR